jgi:hypothetical protein
VSWSVLPAWSPAHHRWLDLNRQRDDNTPRFIRLPRGQPSAAFCHQQGVRNLDYPQRQRHRPAGLDRLQQRQRCLTAFIRHHPGQLG